MPFAQIASAWWIAVAGVLLFLMAVILRLTLTLILQVKQLAATIGEASERLRDAAADIRAESDLASERLERLGRLGDRPLRRRNR